MAGPFNPFGGAVSNGQRGGRGAQGSVGRGRGGNSGLAATHFQGNNARGDGKDRGRGRGRGQNQYRGRGRGRGAGAASHTVNGTQQATAGNPDATTSPFARSNQQNSSVASPFGLQPVQQSPFSALQKSSPASNFSNNPFAKPVQDMNHQDSVAFSRNGSSGPVGNASSGNYQDRYDQVSNHRMTCDREKN